ncbi:hypothetical protein GCM10023350_28420 [Nocardioides endophyticus]|uniref:DUF8017 domain-containing protein n=1 Tax=Nocardioides endophyticus TaxID=1353775 RepID=A0ABP8YZC8_9ACTN
MTRNRVALVLGAVAVLTVLATAALAVSTYVGDDSSPVAEPLVVTDPVSGASFEVPGEGWEVRGPRSRIYYADDDGGRPAAVVSGAAVYRDGYCDEEPGDSNRGFAGFTDQPFEAWVASLTDDDGSWTTGDDREEIELADGTAATLRWTGFFGGEGKCPASGIEVAMVRAGEVRVVLVADSQGQGTLSHDEIVQILRSLRR